MTVRSRITGLLSSGLLLIALASLVWLSRSWSGPQPLVVYCAHDAIFSEQILQDFERRTGIPVAVRFDTEATKSLSLVNLIRSERAEPRCDVFWNNELLGTLDLADEGLLQPYLGTGYERIPAEFKDPGGAWTGFAARLRVFITHAGKQPAREADIERALQGDLSRAAIAKPLYGTTLTHYVVLWHVWGEKRLKTWHRDTRRRGLREVPGNGAVKDLVASGACDFGFTDTDDYFGALDAARPVQMLPCRVDGGKTICVPNSVAIIQGTRQLAAAQRLVDFLLSEETERALANSAARQIPLGPTDLSTLSGDVQRLTGWAHDRYDLRQLGDARQACLAWLKSEYLQ